MDKAEASRSSFTISHQQDGMHLSHRVEMVPYLQFGGIMGKVSYIEISRHAVLTFYCNLNG